MGKHKGKIFFLLLIAGLVGAYVFTENKRELFIDNAAPPLIRNSALIFVKSMNWDEIKGKKIEELREISEKKHLEQYSKIQKQFEILGIKENMAAVGMKAGLAKDEAVDLLSNLKKEDLVKLIEGLPDKAFSTLVRVDFFSSRSIDISDLDSLKKVTKKIEDDFNKAN